MAKLVAFGDSFTWGDELSDICDKFVNFPINFKQLTDNEHTILRENNIGPYSERNFNHEQIPIQKWHSKYTWPSLLANELNLSYVCHAKSGYSNETILRKLIQYIPNITIDDLVVINWTYIDRWDFVNPDILTIDNQWITIRPTNKKKTQFEKFYFKYIQSELLHKWESLKNILLAINILKEKNIKFLMTCNDETILDQIYHAPSYIKNMQLAVKDHIIWFEGKGFNNWCTDNGFLRGKENNHPLDEAHNAAFEYIKKNNHYKATKEQRVNIPQYSSSIQWSNPYTKNYTVTINYDTK